MGFSLAGLAELDVSDSSSYSTLLRDKFFFEIPAALKGFVFQITGGNDKQGGLLSYRVCLFLSDGHSPEGSEKSVCGCHVELGHCEAGRSWCVHFLFVSTCINAKTEIPGLTDAILPNRLGLKGAMKIRKMVNLSRKNDVRKYVIRQEVRSGKKENAKPYTKAPRPNPHCHLRSVKRRKLEHRKEQKSEYE
ncbi:40S ribosomal protein S6 [Desarmillaria tabescens]|uniref:40S ribosomal protein S6 n=1 Tax=Armillaria tabescens TaxID=1929756 RepID=A0AA39MR10_ARMTA|nr:40S ribosomal protein S6 [Desarmillaria tabescens]KAK0443058.1 40S ribosomal protein S6 [Desarmillaria tabescens]